MQINGYHFTVLRAVVVLFDLFLHAFVGYLVVSYFTDYNPLYGALGGFIPNLDLPFNVWPNVFPFVHRGILHTPLFLGLLLIPLLLFDKKQLAIPFAIGYIFELVVDVFESNDGIMWLYPFSKTHYAIPIPHMNLWVIGATGVLGVLVYYDTK